MIWQRFLADQRGNIAILFAVGFAISAVVSAIAVDAAALYHERRLIQNGVDLAALAAATNPAKAHTLARAALVDARLLDADSVEGLAVTTGRYDPDPSVAPSQRFTANATPANAVHVSFARPGKLHFASSWAQQPTIGAQGLATVTPQVAFSVGSRLASLNGGIANALLNALLGSNISLTAMDYNGLLNAQIDAFDFLDALAFQMGLSVGTYDDILAARANHGQIATALAALLNGSQRLSAQALASAAGHNGSLPLSQLFQLGGLGAMTIGSGPSGTVATLSALELLSASAALGNGSHQVALALGAGVPGLVGIDVKLAVGEPPQGGSWYAIGPTGTVVRTAQLRLHIVATILGSGALVGIPVRLPLYLELANAEAVAANATCPTSASPWGQATIRVRPGVLRLMIGDVDAVTFGNFGTTPSVGMAKLAEVKLLGLTVLQALASASVEIAQTTPVALGFTSSDIAAGTVKTAHVSTPIASLTSSLLNNLQVQAPVLGLGLNLSVLTGLLKTILLPLAPVLDVSINRLLGALGLQVGEADIRVYGVRCSHPVLVG